MAKAKKKGTKKAKPVNPIAEGIAKLTVEQCVARLAELAQPVVDEVGHLADLLQNPDEQVAEYTVNGDLEGAGYDLDVAVGCLLKEADLLATRIAGELECARDNMLEAVGGMRTPELDR